MQNESYSLSIVKRLTAGKERWTITKTDGEHTDIGVISEEVKKLTWKSGISTPKPTRIVTPDESAVVFEMLLRKTTGSWKLNVGVPAVFLGAGFFLGIFMPQFSLWFSIGGLLLGFFTLAAGNSLRNPTYDVTDVNGLNIGVVYKDVKASLLRKKCVIETHSGRWRFSETSSSQLSVRLTVFFVVLGAAKVAATRGHGSITQYVAAGIGVAVVSVTSVKMRKKALLLTLENESGVQVGSTTFVNGGYDIQVQDQRLDQRVAAAAGLITADYTGS